jgi:chorismate mutase
MTPLLRAIRGATTVDEDEPEQIRVRTQTLVTAILERNELAIEDLVSIIFTATPDITTAFPATAARALGLDEVPLLGAAEITVEGGPARCIRALVHCYTTRARAEIRHVYLEGARILRADLAD